MDKEQKDKIETMFREMLKEDLDVTWKILNDEYERRYWIQATKDCEEHTDGRTK